MALLKIERASTMGNGKQPCPEAKLIDGQWTVCIIAIGQFIKLIEKWGHPVVFDGKTITIYDGHIE